MKIHEALVPGYQQAKQAILAACTFEMQSQTSWTPKPLKLLKSQAFPHPRSHPRDTSKIGVEVGVFGAVLADGEGPAGVAAWQGQLKAPRGSSFGAFLLAASFCSSAQASVSASGAVSVDAGWPGKRVLGLAALWHCSMLWFFGLFALDLCLELQKETSEVS